MSCRPLGRGTTLLLAAIGCLQEFAVELAADVPRRSIVAYVGTYTPVPGAGEPAGPHWTNGRGVHLFRMDPETGALSPHGVMVSETSPNCLAVNPAGTRLYATNRNSGAPGSGTISCFSIDRSTGKLDLLNAVSSGAAAPNHLSLHPAGKFLFAANYSSGSVAVLPIAADGRLSEAADVKRFEGAVGPDRATSAPPGSFAISGHETPHAHMVQPDPSGAFVLAADMGTDRLMVWRFDATSGRLVEGDFPFASVPPGDGPRHFAFHPNGRWLYSLQEEASTVVLFDYDSATGRLSSRQSLSSLPRGFAGTSFASAIMVSTNGRFVYAVNRLHDSIARFSVDGTGALSLIETEWTRGNYSRHIGLDPTGRFLYSCNQRSDSITTFRVDPVTGALRFTGQFTAVGSPSFIVFVELDS